MNMPDELTGSQCEADTTEYLAYRTNGFPRWRSRGSHSSPNTLTNRCRRPVGSKSGGRLSYHHELYSVSKTLGPSSPPRRATPPLACPVLSSHAGDIQSVLGHPFADAALPCDVFRA